eukprot:g37819.t1
MLGLWHWAVLLVVLVFIILAFTLVQARSHERIESQEATTAAQIKREERKATTAAWIEERREKRKQTIQEKQEKREKDKKEREQNREQHKKKKEEDIRERSPHVQRAKAQEEAGKQKAKAAQAEEEAGKQKARAAEAEARTEKAVADLMAAKKKIAQQLQDAETERLANLKKQAEDMEKARKEKDDLEHKARGQIEELEKKGQQEKEALERKAKEEKRASEKEMEALKYRLKQEKLTLEKEAERSRQELRRKIQELEQKRKETRETLEETSSQRHAERALSRGVRWEYQGKDQQWTCYDASVNKKLETGYQRQKLFDLPADSPYLVWEEQIGSCKYQLDLVNKTQTSVLERVVVKIKRHLPKRELTKSQQQALKDVTKHAKQKSQEAKQSLKKLFEQCGRSETDMARVLKFIEKRAKIHINIDASKEITVGTEKKTSLQLLTSDREGKYRSLFETGTGGGCTRKDDRREWETRMFGEAYDNKDKERPKYGNLNVLTLTEGDRRAFQYGRSYLVLGENVRARCTVTSCDSSENAEIGTLKYCAHVLLDVLQHLQLKHREKLVQVLCEVDQLDCAAGTELPELRDYLEVQIHGDVVMKEDVDVAIAHINDSNTDDKRTDWRNWCQKHEIPAFRFKGDKSVPL